MAENNTPLYCPTKPCLCVGYAYIPPQILNDIYPACEGLYNGTIFPELELSMCEYGNVCKSNGGMM